MSAAFILQFFFIAVVLEQALAFVPTPVSTFQHNRYQNQASWKLYDSPEPLATEGEWAAYLDEENTGVIYYFNTRTGDSLWEPPTNTFPEVYLKPSKRRRAEAKRAEYYKKLREVEGKKGFLSKLLEPKEEDEVLDEEQEPGWMKPVLEEKGFVEEKEKSGLFSRLMNQASAATTTTKTAEPKKVEANEIRVEPTKKAEPSAESSAEKTKGVGSLFGQLLSTSSPSTSNPDTTTKETKAEFKPQAVEETKSQKATGFLDQLFTDLRTESAEAAAAKADAAAIKKAEREAQVAQKKAEKEEKAQKRQLEMQAEAEQKAERDRIAAEEAAAAAEQLVVEEQDTGIQVEIGTCVLPHPSKIMWGGEDAIFSKGRTFGVFDGVSGADKADGLPLYSKMLAREMDTLVGEGVDLNVKDLQNLLLVAAEKADERATGASTAIVASISDNGFLRAINLGDSRCIVIRGGRVVAQTKEIVHYFDCPYQLSEISPDRPRDARKLNVELLKGDIVMMGSDGIFDNLEDDEIVEIINSTTDVKAAAKQISDRSRKVSLDSQASTPYSKQAKKNGDPDFQDGKGGKVDDISCVVAQYM